MLLLYHFVLCTHIHIFHGDDVFQAPQSVHVYNLRKFCIWTRPSTIEVFVSDSSISYCNMLTTSSMLQSYTCFHSSPTHKSLKGHVRAQFHKDYSENSSHLLVGCHLWNVPLPHILCHNILQLIYIFWWCYIWFLVLSFLYALGCACTLHYLSFLALLGTFMPKCLSSPLHYLHGH